MKEILELIRQYERNVQKLSEKEFIRENNYYEYEFAKIILSSPELYPREVLELMKNAMDKRRIDFIIVDKMREFDMNTPERREKWVVVIKNIADNLYKFTKVSLQNNHKESYDEIIHSLKTNEFRKIGSKAVLIAFCEHLTDNEEFKQPLLTLTKKMNFTRCKNFISDLVELVSKKLSNGTGETDLERNNKDLRTSLEMTQRQLEHLEEEIEEIKAEAKKEAVLHFFQEMNSLRYSNLFDQFANAEALIKKLDQNDYQIPEEIESIPFVVRMFMNFVRKYGIIPLEQKGLKKIVTLHESEQYEYVGSEFSDNVEQKQVEIVAPGWKYAETIISRPHVKEII